MGRPSIQTIEEYISQLSDGMQLKLSRLRKIINQTAPSADGRPVWGVPTYYQRRFLVEFAAFKNHIGFYCTLSILEHLRKGLGPCRTNTKNAIQVHTDQPLSEELTEKLVRFRLKKNRGRSDFAPTSVYSHESPVTYRRAFVLLQRM